MVSVSVSYPKNKDLQDVDSVMSFVSCKALKLSNSERSRALKLSTFKDSRAPKLTNFERFRALKSLNFH